MCGIAGYINNVSNFDQGQSITLLNKFCSLNHEDQIQKNLV